MSKENKILLIGMGCHAMGRTAQILEIIKTKYPDHEIVAEPEKMMPFDSISRKEIPVIDYVKAPELKSMYQEKQFICNGNHQYKEVKSEYQDGTAWIEWVCQCGKKL